MQGHYAVIRDAEQWAAVRLLLMSLVQEARYWVYVGLAGGSLRLRIRGDYGAVQVRGMPR